MTGYQLAPFQRRTWLLGGADHLLVHQVAVTIAGPLDVLRLGQALDQVAARHEGLRTSYPLRPGVRYPVQVVEETARIELQYTDLSGLPRAMRQSGAAGLHQAALDRAPRAQQAGRWEVMLVRLEAQLHELILLVPALVADLPSVALVLQETARCYGRPGAAGEEEPAQFVQFSEWQNQLQAEGNAEAARYWQQLSLDERRSAPLPFERKPAAAAPEMTEVPLPAGRADRLTALAARHCLSAEALVLACWTALLWHYLDRPGTVLLGRTEPGRNFEPVRGMVGPLAKMLPLATQPRTGTSLLAYARQVDQALRLAEGWQDYFDWKTGKEGPALAAVHHFDAGFEYNALGNAVLRAGETTFAVSRLFSCNDAFKIKLFCHHWQETLRLDLCVQPGWFVPGSVACVTRQLAEVIDKAVEDPGTPLEALLVATGNEVLRSEAPAGTRLWTSVTAWFAATVARHGRHDALKVDGRTFSYDALDRMANGVAACLTRRYATGPGDIVAIRSHRNEKMIAALLGILKTGAAYLPVDPSTPPARLAYLLGDSRAKVLLTDEVPAEADLPATPYLLLGEELVEPAGAAPAVAVTATDPAYVIYTSGSTGQPKGVVVTHGSLTNYLAWFAGSFGLTAADQTLLFASIAFDLSYTALWSSLVNGCTLHLAGESAYFDPLALQQYLARENVTFLKITPSQFGLLVNDAAFAQTAGRFSLRLIVTGGEPIKVQDVEKYFAHHPGVQFVNHYGPTETTIGILAQPFGAAGFGGYQSKPVVGRPVSGNQVYILRDGRTLQPVGITGEICVAGESLAAGYLNREALTAEKFTANPFDPGGRLYRTGDLGRLLPDGTVELLGRSDCQVKINGYRVEPGEIEQALLGFPGVEEAAVLARTEAGGEKSLVAFLRSPRAVDGPRLRQYLKEYLPDFMIPTHLMTFPAFPLLPNGKTDNQALLAQGDQALRSQADHTPPHTELEKQLARVWQHVLGTDRVGVHSNFFEQGGNSLKMIAMLRQLSELFPGRITVADLFKYNTIHSIATFLGGEAAPEGPIEAFEV
jgi:amino acid adenylation domain-containing protein